ncbi:hypothetical protein MW887_011966 [Aspergillus wentii]|nr:hypothetical protein MW887_011966 [Aspergillus wentii]
MDDFSFPLLESNVFRDLMEIAPNAALGIWYMARNLLQPLLPSTSPYASQSTALSWLYLISAAAIRDTLAIELFLGIQDSLSFHPLSRSPISPRYGSLDSALCLIVKNASNLSQSGL